MAKTRAQNTAAGRRVYGENYATGIAAEERAARILRGRGYSVAKSPGSRGKYDLLAKKGNEVKRVQVKAITSRALCSEGAARRRVAGRPFDTTRRGVDEIWVFDRDGRRWELGA